MAGKAPGWNAKDLLQPLWVKYPGGRDALAKKVGTTGTALSSRNSGARPLGHDLGERLARELGVSLVDLGAPEATAGDQRGQGILDRLEELAADLAETARALARLQERVAKLEAPPSPGADQSKGQGGGS